MGANRGLYQLRDERFAESLAVLSRALADPSSTIRAQAMGALDEHSSLRVPIIRRLARESRYADVRQWAASN
jgi:hypothetical protein